MALEPVTILHESHHVAPGATSYASVAGREDRSSERGAITSIQSGGSTDSVVLWGAFFFCMLAVYR